MLTPKQSQGGLTLIELMVTILILLVGLLGLAGLQSRLQQAEIESYQRAQALILLGDMASRMQANRYNAADYITGTDLAPGTAIGAQDCAPAGPERHSIDRFEWCQALLGAAETDPANNRVGAMIGGRGCIQDMGNREYMITVAWQGLIDIEPPPASVACGQGAFGDERQRRAVTTLIRIADLSEPP